MFTTEELFHNSTVNIIVCHYQSTQSINYDIETTKNV